MMNISFDFDIPVVTMVLLGVLFVVTLLLITVYRARISKVVDRRADLENRPVEIAVGAMPRVSVVVYARDNSERLERLLAVLLKQDYAAGYEVVVVNDGGGHAVGDVVTRHSMSNPNLRLTFVPDNAHNLSRKKLAITLGVKAARNECVLLLAAECELPGTEWLASMARHFAAGKSVVLGNGVIKNDDDSDMRLMHRFGQAHTAVTWSGAALAGSPYRGNGYNIGYTKALFFDHKGFARTLNIHDGDDDLFISEIASSGNTAVELSGDSIVTVRTSRPARLYADSKKRHAFTGRMLKNMSRRLMAAGAIALWLSIALAVASGVIGYPNLVPACVALVMILVQWIVLSIIWRKGAAAVGVAVKGAAVMPALLMIPFHNLKYKLASRRDTHMNYTWHHK